jgi:hypothetical protein
MVKYIVHDFYLHTNKTNNVLPWQISDLYNNEINE